MIKQENSPDFSGSPGQQGDNEQPFFRKKFIVKNTIWFALITVATIAAIFIYNNTGNTIAAFKHIKLKFILLCFIMLAADLTMGSWRNHIYVRKLNPEVSYWVSFKANVANMFMGAVTPAHGGAGPAQIYVYMRNKVSFLDAFAVSLINFGATLIFMPLAGFVALLLMNKETVGGIIPSLLKYGFTFFALFLTAFLLAFWKPVWIGVFINKIAVFLSKILPRRKARLFAAAERSQIKIADYQKTCSVIIKKNPWLFPFSIIITIVMYLNKYCMQYVILLGLGVKADILQVIAIQVLIQFMIYFTPTPGGSGFAELSISVLFRKIVPASVLSLFTLLQRSFLLFFPAIIGAVVMISLLQKQANQKTVANV